MKTIKRILWTWSWEGFSVEFVDGSRQNLSAKQLMGMVGEKEFDRLNQIASRLTGHWHNVD